MSHQLNLNSSSSLRDQTVKSIQNNSNEYIGINHSKKPLKGPNEDSSNKHSTSSNIAIHHQSLTARTQQLLHTTDTVSQIIKKLMEFQQQSLLGTNSNKAIENPSLLQQLLINPNQIGDCLRDQCANHTIFNGGFFDLLKKLLAQYKHHPHIQDSLTNFLKHYDLFASKEFSFQCLTHSLTHLSSYLGEGEKKAIQQVMQQSLTLLNGEGEISNLSQLKETLLPILGRLASKNPENSQLRNQIMHSIHNLSRLDHTSHASLLKSLDQLVDTLQQFTRISIHEQDALKAAMLNTLNQRSNLEPNLLDPFLDALEDQLSNHQPLQTQGATYQFLQSYLLNKSILLPILYCFIPLQLNEGYALAELWVDPDENHQQHSTTKKTKLFFTVDIPSTGYFQCYLELKNQTITLDIEGPESILPLLDGLSNHMKTVSTKYGFQLAGLTISKLTYPKKFTEVFGHKILKEVSVNVII